jgi:GT2 family glycosyltransferase
MRDSETTHGRFGSEATGSPLRVSVIVMTRDRPESLRRCLESLAQQTLAPNAFDVVVVDASDALASSVVAAFEDRLAVRHEPIENGGVAANRNAGVELAHAPIVAFLDDDCVAEERWLETLTRAVEQHDRTLVGGRVENRRPADPFAVAGQVITEGVHSFFNPAGGEARFVPGLNFALARDAYLALGGCDATFGRLAAEDRDFVDRWRLTGGRLLSCPDALVFHEHRSTLAGFLRQYVNYGRGAWRYHSLRRRRKSGRMAQDLGLHLSLPRYLGPPVMRLRPAMRAKVIPLLVAWQAATAVGYAFQGVVEALGGVLERRAARTSSRRRR